MKTLGRPGVDPDGKITLRHLKVKECDSVEILRDRTESSARIL